jgi:hypothetical protein
MVQQKNDRARQAERHSRIEVVRNSQRRGAISNVVFYDALHPSRRNRREVVYPHGRQLKKIAAVMSILLDDAVITEPSTQDTYSDRIGLCELLLRGLDPMTVYETGRNCYNGCAPPLPAECEHFMTEGGARLLNFFLERPHCSPATREKLENCRPSQPSVSPSLSSTLIIPPKRSFASLSSEPEPSTQGSTSNRLIKEVEVKRDSPEFPSIKDENLVDAQMLRKPLSIRNHLILETLQKIKSFLGEIDRIMNDNQSLKQMCIEKDEKIRRLSEEIRDCKAAAKAYEEITGIVRRQEQ